MKTFILVLLVGACLAATVERPDFKKKRHETALENPKSSLGKTRRDIDDLMRKYQRNIRLKKENSDVNKRYDDYYGYDDYDYDDYGYDDYGYDDYGFEDYVSHLWQEYWYGWFTGEM